MRKTTSPSSPTAVACLQEIKTQDEGFPAAEFEKLGYHAIWHGQKGFNGVAILADGTKPVEVLRGLPGDPEDEQSRYLEADVFGVRVACIYLPNGNPQPGPKFDYKLAWMARMEARVREVLAAEEAAIFAGDYNVIPQPEDAARPEAWTDDALFLPKTRAAYRRLLNLGLTDAFRAREPRPGHYSFWDYQAGAWERNNGIRIDHLLLTPQAADMLAAAGIDKQVRGREKPSDHVPAWVELG